MANESVYVAIAIACVVALLMFAIFVIYCIKRQQDKLQERQARERRLREERQRRHHMRVQMVRPPPYEASRGPQQTGYPANREIPYSPPPEYKEVATPLPTPRHNQAVGIGGYPPQYTEIPSVSRNVAPANTYYISNSYPVPPGSTSLNDGSNNNSISNNASNTITNRNIYNQSPRRQNGTPIQSSDNTIQVQVSPRVGANPRRALPDVVTSATDGSRLANQNVPNDAWRPSSTNAISSNQRSGVESTNRLSGGYPSEASTNPREAQHRTNPGLGARASSRLGTSTYQPQAISAAESGRRANAPASPYISPNISQNESARSGNAHQSNTPQNGGQVSSQLQDLSLI